MEPLSKKLSHHFLDAFSNSDVACLSKITPQGLDQSAVVSSNADLAETLGIDNNYLDDPDTLKMLSGNFVPSSVKPVGLSGTGVPLLCCRIVLRVSNCMSPNWRENSSKA